MKKFRGLGFLIFLAVFAAASAVVMLLWNSVAVNVFPVGHLTFWYAAGLLVLAKLLLGGWHHGHSHFHKHHGGFGKKGKHIRDRLKECCTPDEVREMHERFHSMSHAERKEHIRRHMAGGFHGRDGQWYGGPYTGDSGNAAEKEEKTGDNGSNG